LLEETQAFCRSVGLREYLIVEIAKADNDWGLERRACYCRAPSANYKFHPRSAATMPTSMTTIERAFFLARSGECTCVDNLIERLNREGYDGRRIQGRLLRKQLRDLIQGAIKRQPKRPSESAQVAPRD
jgi:hypothetical protein